MDIHEYQAKQILSEFSVPIPLGDVAHKTHEAERVARWLDEDIMVIKAQIHAGGRGKSGGIKVVKSVKEAMEVTDAMLGSVLKTPQTPPEGKIIHRVYVETACNIEKEYYFCILIDRETGGNTIIASTEGGVEIEEITAKKPEKIFRVRLGPGADLHLHHVRKLSYDLGMRDKIARKAQRVFLNIYRAFVERDAAMIEINPIVVTVEEDIVVLDCKASFDDNALYRQRQVEEMCDDREMDPLELEASRHDLNYVKLDGNIGLMVNGAGLSMATMDLIQYYGGQPANFMDVAGAATPERVAAAFKLIYRDPDVKGILLNIFGGMMRCNDIAEGLVQAAHEVGLSKPLVVRLEGTNIEKGRDILKNSGLPIDPVSGMDEAAKKIVLAVKERN